MSPPLRLGFPVKVTGDPALKSHDARRWQSSPHLRVSIGHLREIFAYLAKHRIGMYRMSSDLAPYATHPGMPQFHGMVRESRAELEALGAEARAQGLRLSTHPAQFIVLNSPDPKLVASSVAELALHAEILDAMGMGPEAVAVLHVGGAYGDRAAGVRAWIETWATLPEPVRRRLALEHDDVRFSATDVLKIHEATGVRLVFDYQHFWCLNPEGLDMRGALLSILRTWPEGVRPKIHFSTPRTELRQVKRSEPGTRKLKTVNVAPIWTGHADFCNPFEFATFMRGPAADLECDVMLESKSKDLALIRLRPDLLRYAPDVAARFGLGPAEADALGAEEAELLEAAPPVAAEEGAEPALEGA